MGYKPQVEKDARSLKRRIADARVALAKAETSRQVPPRQAALQEATLCGMTDYNCCFEAKRMLVDLLIKHDNQIKKAAAFRVSDMGPKERVLSSCRGKLGGGEGGPSVCLHLDAFQQNEDFAMYADGAMQHRPGILLRKGFCNAGRLLLEAIRQVEPA